MKDLKSALNWVTHYANRSFSSLQARIIYTTYIHMNTYIYICICVFQCVYFGRIYFLIYQAFPVLGKNLITLSRPFPLATSGYRRQQHRPLHIYYIYIYSCIYIYRGCCREHHSKWWDKMVRKIVRYRKEKKNSCCCECIKRNMFEYIYVCIRGVQISSGSDEIIQLFVKLKFI